MVYKRESAGFEIPHIYNLRIFELIDNFSKRGVDIDKHSSLLFIHDCLTFHECLTNDPFKKSRIHEFPLETPLSAEYHSQISGYKLISFPKTKSIAKSILEIVLERDIRNGVCILNCSVSFKCPYQESGRELMERAESTIREFYGQRTNRQESEPEKVSA